MKKIILSVLAFFSLSLLARADVIVGLCESVEDSRQIFLCSVHAKTRADQQLNLSYQNALRRIAKQYEQSAMLADEYISLLRGSQRAWIKLRDANCELESFEIERGTQAYEVTVNSCIARMSRHRAGYLDKVAPDL
ncbi:lysozyme inhibitor LprI family protein [Stutzerimonas nitrititolerans]|uniref:lysozyme inhibitor LprI family protein n=1 Tax=Stutzerimonas nitrititolerans TaxID=2482751 RepID=UPI00289DBC5B|nr:lysozyme inhibitor LprI family protein [Stutzerimonas nitrititolerans]